MKKIIAVEVAPEHTESPLLLLWDISDIKDTYLEGLIFDGNKDYCSHMTDEYSTIKSGVENALYYIDNVEIYANENATETELIEIIKDYLELDVTEEQLNYVIDAIESVACEKRNWENSMCYLLEIATGKKYDYAIIRGCAQREWQGLYYPSDKWSDEAINALETEYFNTGIEYDCYEVDTDVIGEDNIRGDKIDEIALDHDFTSVYTHHYSTMDQQKEIADAFGVSIEDVIMFSIKSRFSKYTYRKIAEGRYIYE